MSISKGKSNVVLKGDLNKQGGFFHNWKKRHFVLTRSNKRLTYYADEKKQEKKGEIDLTRVKEIMPTSTPKNSFHLTCTVPKRTYVIQAASPAKRTKWINAIKAVKAGKPWPPVKSSTKRQPKRPSNIKMSPVVANNNVIYQSVTPPSMVAQHQFAPTFIAQRTPPFVPLSSPAYPPQVVCVPQPAPVQHVSYNVQYISQSSLPDATPPARTASSPIFSHPQAAVNPHQMIRAPSAPPMFHSSSYGGNELPTNQRGEGQPHHFSTTNVNTQF